MDNELILQCKNITKTFDGIKALDNVSLDLRSNEIRGLLGQNGAGKSTLVNILTGCFRPDSGEIIIKGEEVTFGSTRDSKKYGIQACYQNFSLLPDLTIAENIFLHDMPTSRGGLIDDKRMERETRELLEQHDITLSPSTPVRDLSISERQIVEILKALAQNPHILLLDEPTASLPRHEAKILHARLKNLQTGGIPILYISHIIEDVVECADNITILRNGKKVCTIPRKDFNLKDIGRNILGKESIESEVPKRSLTIEGAGLKVEGLTVEIGHQELKDIDFEVGKGEVLGLAGVVGSGPDLIVETLYGLHKIQAGSIYISGQKVSIENVGAAYKAGMGLVPRDRHNEGAIKEHSIESNIGLCSYPDLGGLVFNRKKQRGMAESQIRSLSIGPPNPDQLVMDLSGGNQQKVVLGKWLACKPKVLLLSEPLAGIDIGAKEDFIHLIRDKAREEKIAVLVSSSDLPWLRRMCDRIVAFSISGRISQVFTEIPTEEELLIAIQ